jgi:hypothetical protein
MGKNICFWSHKQHGGSASFASEEKILRLDSLNKQMCQDARQKRSNCDLEIKFLFHSNYFSGELHN